MRVFILAAGQRTLWSGDTPKQLLDVGGGEVFLGRIIRQCNQREIDDVVVVAWQDDIRDFAIEAGASVFNPENRRYTCEGFLSTRKLWIEENVVLLGDVYYTKATFDYITQADGVKFIGNQWELYGFRFSAPDANLMERNLKSVIDGAVAGGCVGMGKVRFLKKKYTLSKKSDQFYETIYDGTQDVDDEKFYAAFVREKINEETWKYDTG